MNTPTPRSARRCVIFIAMRPACSIACSKNSSQLKITKKEPRSERWRKLTGIDWIGTVRVSARRIDWPARPSWLGGGEVRSSRMVWKFRRVAGDRACRSRTPR